MLSVEDLRHLVDDGEVDTVVVAITDMQGRLQGKRLHARYFLDVVLEHGTEGCNYLLAVDVDMNTVDGYAMSSWSSGYGDFVMQPGPRRRCGRSPGSRARRWCSPTCSWQDGSPVVASPRQILRRQTGPAGRRRDGRLRRHRAGVHRLPGHLRAGLDGGLPGPHAGQPVQRRLLAARHGAGRAAAARDPQRDDRRRPGRRVGQGRVQPRPARDRLPVRRGARDLRQPRRSTRTAPRRSPRRRAWR